MRRNHRRYNPLLDEWVIVASNRVFRPWQGSKTDPCSFTPTNETNPLAPGGKRFNDVYMKKFDINEVFSSQMRNVEVGTQEISIDEYGGKGELSARHLYINDLFLPAANSGDELFREMEIRGVCRVVCYHPDTNKSIATMSLNEIFENRGAAVGCSNAHPHGQIWAGNFLPSLPYRKDKCQKAYYSQHGRPLLMDVLRKEKSNENERIVLQNEHWTVFVPYWAVWPYETMMLPNRHVLRIDELLEHEKISLADILRRLIIKYDNIFKCPFPFSMGWLGAPTGPRLSNDNNFWQLHASFHPPLLRSATVPKFMAGYEVFSEPQRDITPEAAAATIRAQSEVHYSV
ncbi:UTP--hexose-1-phosphate uridylyltransferase [Dictyocaulus viviparus]|uniref:Galactose-1-phosphate uridylyltransferase n=1 Tax=Dictyocaulus viviparus TaxID=29172 RepID=A0A0D8YD07_DICVI|nr:UTP--hexose-1-phosphate uridylyltransferase [Dictyocaulus viviparus]